MPATTSACILQRVPSRAAPHSELVALLAEAFGDYPTWKYVLRTSVAFRKRFVAFLYREMVFAEMASSSTGLGILALDSSTGTVVGGLFLSSKSYTTHGLLPDPVSSYPTLKDTSNQTRWRSRLRGTIRSLRLMCCYLAVPFAIGVPAMRRLLSYSAGGKLCNRAFAVALGLKPASEEARLGAPQAHWRIDHIFVSASHRGRGVCRELLADAARCADAAGATLYLSTSSPSNVAMYRKLGYTVVGGVRSLEPLKVLTPAEAEAASKACVPGSERETGLVTTGMARAPGGGVPAVIDSAASALAKHSDSATQRKVGAAATLFPLAWGCALGLFIVMRLFGGGS